MQYNFDEIIDRRNTLSFKYDRLDRNFGRSDLMPLWVADMDFATPDFILDTLKKRLEHPVLGYSRDPDDWAPAVIDWEKSHHGWEIAPESLCFINGIMKGIGLAINRLVPEGKKVIIQPPVYHMFKYVSDGNGRELVYNPLKERADGLYDMDFENLEKVIDEDCKMLILANPHNPGGVCWSKETLATLAEICARHNIIVISDEIHADMALFGHKHVPFATVSETAANISITFGAPTKVFNMP
ncbi:MAG: aminotransferase class I/II-fold pyridoxal phosphate-dependent enzyme, partial [Bacteroidales bacterium]|nr:aminotransferase class I/II-fold pyridoxal phosphate-dependent enzyme [Bacteroidales bacterium]